MVAADVTSVPTSHATGTPLDFTLPQDGFLPLTLWERNCRVETRALSGDRLSPGERPEPWPGRPAPALAGGCAPGQPAQQPWRLQGSCFEGGAFVCLEATSGSITRGIKPLTLAGSEDWVLPRGGQRGENED